MAGKLNGLSDLANTVKNDKRVLLLDCSEVESKEQTRRVFNNIEQLAETIRQEGQLQPIKVAPKNSVGKYVILQGERRWRACKLLGIKVEAIVHKGDQDQVSTLASELIENIQREDLEPKEIAESLSKFSDWGMGQKAIAERIGRSESYVSSHLSLMKLPECVDALYNRGHVRDTETLNNLRLLYSLDPSSAEAVCKDAAINTITRVESRKLLRAAKRDNKQDSGQGHRIGAGAGAGAGACAGADVGMGSSVNPDGIHSRNIGPEGGSVGPSAGIEEQPNRHRKAGIGQSKQKNGNKTSWSVIEPGSLRINVSIKLEDGTEANGYILNDRIDEEPEYIWAMVMISGSEEAIRAHGSDIQIISSMA